MKLSVTAWSFPVLSLDEVGGLAKVLGIEAIDVSFFYASALDRAIVQLGKSDANKRWGEYMGPIMKIETDTLRNFSFLLPLQFHMD